MYNVQPGDDMPSSSRLFRSTIVAALAAAAILLTVVLPAEYGMDPTGIGRALGLTEMGEIKRQLAQEAASDHDTGLVEVVPAEPSSAETESPPNDGWRDEVEVTLAPGEGVELKLVMTKGSRAHFEWSANGSALNYDAHGHGGDESVTYGKGRGASGDTGVLEAAFDGHHGWFWRNRTEETVTLTLRTRGDYAELKRAA